MPNTPPPREESPAEELTRVLGSPAGRANAARVQEACRLIQALEITDEEYSRGASWNPGIPISKVLSQVIRPSVFVLQQAVDPSFHRTGYAAFEFPYPTTCVLRRAFRKIMELLVCWQSFVALGP